MYVELQGFDHGFVLAFLRFALPFGPFDQEPFCVPQRSPPVIPMCRPNTHRSKTQGQIIVAAGTPGDQAIVQVGSPMASVFTLTGW